MGCLSVRSRCCPNRVCSKYFLTISCIRTTTYGAHICFQLHFCEWLLHQHTADMLLVHNILWTDEACFTREDAFSVHNSHLWARDNPDAVRERGISSETLSRPPSATRQPDCSTILWFSGNCSAGAAWRCASTCKRLWLQHDVAPPHYGEDVRQSLNMTYPGGGLDVEADCMTSFVAGSNSSGFSPRGGGGHLKEHFYGVLPRSVEDLVARLQAAVTTVDVIVLRPVSR
jgi:hypothetical protein